MMVTMAMMSHDDWPCSSGFYHGFLTHESMTVHDREISLSPEFQVVVFEDPKRHLVFPRQPTERTVRVIHTANTCYLCTFLHKITAAEYVSFL